MPRKRTTPKLTMVSVRLSDEEVAQLAELAEHFSSTRTAVVKLLLKRGYATIMKSAPKAPSP